MVAKLRAGPDESEVLRQSGPAARQLEVKDQLPIGDSLHDRAVVWARPSRFVSAPDPAARRIYSPAAALTIAALRGITRRDRVLVRTVGSVQGRYDDLAGSELTRGAARRLPIALEEAFGGVGEITTQRVERERIQAPLASDLHPRITTAAPEESCASAQGEDGAGEDEKSRG
jgi:hypothetical protein